MLAGAPAAVAVDGGNSKTDAVVLAADGNVLASVRGGPSGHQLIGLDAAVAELLTTIRSGLGAAGALRAAEEAGAAGALPLAVLCLAGLDLPVDELRLGQALDARPPAERLVLENDTMAVLRAGVDQGWGVAVVCGTGINCAGLGPDGAAVRFPSLGELSGDLAHGGLWLGVRSLGLALRSGDGRGRPTRLAELVAAHFDLASPDAVLEGVYTGTLPYGRLAELAKVTLDAAAEDEVARGAVDLLADEIVALATATIRRLGVADRPVEVVLGGGVVETSDDGFHDRICTGVRSVAPAAILRHLEQPPVLGAALLALDALGSGPEAVARLQATFTPPAPAPSSTPSP